MNNDDLKEKILNEFAIIAPEIGKNDIEEDVDFRDQFDFDSMDFLNFVIGLSKSFGQDIPESDYPKLTSLNGCLHYFSN